MSVERKFHFTCDTCGMEIIKIEEGMPKGWAYVRLPGDPRIHACSKDARLAAEDIKDAQFKIDDALTHSDEGSMRCLCRGGVKIDAPDGTPCPLCKGTMEVPRETIDRMLRRAAVFRELHALKEN